jgi:hypothetical protein
MPILHPTQAIVAFECKKHDEAISRADDLINIMDKLPYIAVRVHPHEKRKFRQG